VFPEERLLPGSQMFAPMLRIPVNVITESGKVIIES
jgi:hypothetical protein